MFAARITALRPYVLTIGLTGLRVWLAGQWLNSGLHKISDPAWMDGSGRGLLAFWKAALATNAHGGNAITVGRCWADAQSSGETANAGHHLAGE